MVGSANRCGVSLKTDVNPAIDVIIRTCAGSSQVAFNLLSNAVKFNLMGQVGITAKLECSSAHHGVGHGDGYLETGHAMIKQVGGGDGQGREELVSA